MHRKQILAAGVALLACTLTPAAVAAAAGPAVTVRIEGKSKTLLAAKVEHAPAGSVTKDGHSCSGNSAAGAFNAATRGKWSGTWSKSLSDFQVMTILGDTENYTTTKSYWELFVNNVPASTGICGVKLKAGENILFAAVGASETPADPLGVEAPTSEPEFKKFTIKVVYYNAKGKASPAAGVTVAFAGHRYTTNSAGETAKVAAETSGALSVTAAKKGYIRAEATVKVPVTLTVQ
jgi:Domain of unknown function (DUF4430)